jgi:hypothetical protein
MTWLNEVIFWLLAIIAYGALIGWFPGGHKANQFLPVLILAIIAWRIWKGWNEAGRWCDEANMDKAKRELEPGCTVIKTIDDMIAAYGGRRNMIRALRLHGKSLVPRQRCTLAFISGSATQEL